MCFKGVTTQTASVIALSTIVVAAFEVRQLHQAVMCLRLAVAVSAQRR